MFIYKITNILNGKCYIGKTYNTEKRFEQHRQAFKTGTNKFYKAIREFGLENFKFEVLFECNYKDADTFENYMIDFYNSKADGYNTAYRFYSKSEAEKLYSKILDNTYVVTVPYVYTRGKLIMCLDDEEIFESGAQCAEYYGLCGSHIHSVCRGFRAQTGGLHFRYLDENMNIIEPAECAREKGTEVYVEETCTIYPTIADSLRDLGLDVDACKSAVSKHLQGKMLSVHGYHWRYFKDGEVCESLCKSKRKPARSVIVDYSMEFSSVAEALEYFDLPKNGRGAVGLCANGKQASAYGHIWRYSDNLDVKPYDSKNDGQTKVIVDNCMVFDSINSAIQSLGLKDSARLTVKKCITGTRKLRDGSFSNFYEGHTWEKYIED